MVMNYKPIIKVYGDEKVGYTIVGQVRAGVGFAKQLNIIQEYLRQCNDLDSR